MLFPKPENKYKHFERVIVKIKRDCSMYESDSVITHTREPYVILGLNQYTDRYSKFIPAETEMYIDKMKRVRTIDSDYWYAAGRICINGRMYDVGYDLHHSYLEFRK
jgi:hypothetical protein